MSRKTLYLQTKGVSKKRVRRKQGKVTTQGARGAGPEDSNRPIHGGGGGGGGGGLSNMYVQEFKVIFLLHIMQKSFNGDVGMRCTMRKIVETR